MKIITKRQQKAAEERLAKILVGLARPDGLLGIHALLEAVEGTADVAYIIGGTNTVYAVGEKAEKLSAEVSRRTAVIETIKRSEDKDGETGKEKEDPSE